ncbi:head-tail connector protein [bacterium]|nr:head-tail connector protein [bacterium]
MPADPQQLAERHAALKSDRASWDSWCQELGQVVSPRKAEITTKNTTPSGDKESRLYNTTAVECNITNAGGCMGYIFPVSERWFNAEPPADVKDDSAFAWYAKCAEIMLSGMANSNFYSEAHEACLDRSGFGTGMLYIEESITSASGLIFDAVPVGTYAMAENSEKIVDTTFREREMTAMQLAQEFGEEKLPKKVADALKDAARRNKDKFMAVHAVYPREDRDTMKLDSLNMGVASCWFMPDEKILLREGGYESNPYLASRYLKWGSEVYGWCPGWQALPAAKQLNFLERMMDGMAEVQLYPRMLIPSTLEGAVGMGAGAVTIYNPFQSAKPEMWGTEGRIDAGLERLARREQEIKDAYHYDLFKMFAQLDKQMTRAEVLERASEKLILFSPTFNRMTSEWLNPLLQRVFRIYMKQGKFPEPPPSVIALDAQGPHVRPPHMLFTSRVALAIRALQSSGFMHLLEALQPMLAIDPSVRHVIKVSAAAKGLGRNFGVPEEWMASEEEFQGAVQAEQAAMQQAQAMEGAAGLMGTAGKLKPEQINAVAGALGQGKAA